jgi:hypothetical protein
MSTASAGALSLIVAATKWLDYNHPAAKAMSQDAVKLCALAVDDHPTRREGIAAFTADGHGPAFNNGMICWEEPPAAGKSGRLARSRTGSLSRPPRTARIRRTARQSGWAIRICPALSGRSNRWFGVSQLASPAPGQLGNGGKGAIRGSGQPQMGVVISHFLDVGADRTRDSAGPEVQLLVVRALTPR